VVDMKVMMPHPRRAVRWAKTHAIELALSVAVVVIAVMASPMTAHAFDIFWWLRR